MRLRHIEIFYHVYREGSISAAARALSVSQPSVSKVLRHAEDQLGFALFERRKGRLFPTTAADELYRSVSDIYDQVSSLNRAADNIRNRRGGHVALGALPSLAFAIVPPLVASMREENSELSFDLGTLHSDEVAAGLIERRYDLCIGFDAEFDPRIRCQAINSVELALLCRAGSVENDNGVVSPDVLDRAEIVGLRDSGPVADRIENYLSEVGVEPTVSVSAQTYYIAAELVKLGVGPAIVDGFTAQRFAGGELEALSLPGSPTLPFAALYLAEAESNPFVEETLAALRRQFG